MIKNYFLLILLMALVTYIPRFVPLFLFSKANLPKWFIKWLKYIPVGVLSAILAPSILMRENQLNFSIHNPFLLSAILCFIVAAISKNIFLTVLIGIITYGIFSLIL
jgi:branched-subunit amino acid transport protein